MTNSNNVNVNATAANQVAVISGVNHSGTPNSTVEAKGAKTVNTQPRYTNLVKSLKAETNFKLAYDTNFRNNFSKMGLPFRAKLKQLKEQKLAKKNS